MSALRKTTTSKAEVPKEAGCCGGDQDKHGKHQAASSIAPGKAKPADRDAHEHADGVDGGCCGGGKTGK